MAPVDGSGGLQGEKNFKFFFVPDKLKSPKTTCLFLFFSTLGGWVGGSEASVEFYTLFLNPSLMNIFL